MAQIRDRKAGGNLKVLPLIWGGPRGPFALAAAGFSFLGEKSMTQPWPADQTPADAPGGSGKFLGQGVPDRGGLCSN